MNVWTILSILIGIVLLALIILCAWKGSQNEIDPFSTTNNDTTPLSKNWKRPYSLRQCDNRTTFGSGAKKYNCSQFSVMRGGESGQRRSGLPTNMKGVQKGEVCYLDPTSPELKDQLKDENGVILSQPMCVTDERLKQLIPCDKYTKVINNMNCGDFSQLNTFTQRKILGSFLSSFPEAPPGGICYSEKQYCEIDKSAAENRYNAELLECDLDYKFSEKQRVPDAVDRTCVEWAAASSTPAEQRRLGLPSSVRPVKRNEVCWNKVKNQCQELPVGSTEKDVRDAQSKVVTAPVTVPSTSSTPSVPSPSAPSSASVPSTPVPVASSPVVEKFMRYQ